MRPRTSKALIVKLTPNTADVARCALAAEAGGADAVSLINTLRALALAPGEVARPGSAVAPVASPGPAIRPSRSPRWRRSPTRVAIPVVGMGGVRERRPRARLLDVGATLVAVGTESFRDPAVGGADRARARADGQLAAFGSYDA